MLCAERGGKTARVIRINLRFVSRARDSDIGKAAVDETSWAVRIDIDKNAPSRKPLGAVRRYGVTMIEGSKFFRIEDDDAAILAVELHRNLIAAESLDCPQFAPDDAKLLVGRSELKSVAGGELALGGLEDVNAAKPLGIVGDGSTVSLFDRNGVLTGRGGEHGCGAATLDAEFLAAGGVLNNVSGLVSDSPCTVGSGNVGPVIKRLESFVLRRDSASGLQLGSRCLVDLLPTAVIGRDDDGVLRLGSVILGDKPHSVPGA